MAGRYLGVCWIVFLGVLLLILVLGACSSRWLILMIRVFIVFTSSSLDIVGYIIGITGFVGSAGYSVTDCKFKFIDSGWSFD